MSADERTRQLIWKLIDSKGESQQEFSDAMERFVCLNCISGSTEKSRMGAGNSAFMRVLLCF